GRSRVRLHRFSLPRNPRRIWANGADLYHAGKEGNRGLHHRTLRLMEARVDARLHTDRHYEAELKELHLKILEMGGFVEKQIATAMTALIDRDDELARQTIDRDATANRMDVEVDDLCLRLLALHQPAAKDLRLITTALKITTDLERIG